jgi:predicted CoA-binding protein
MVARRGVKKGVKGVGMSFNPDTKNLFVVYDMQKRGFRMVNLNTLIEAKVNGITIKFI